MRDAKALPFAPEGDTPSAVADAKVVIISPVSTDCSWQARVPSGSYHAFRSLQRSGGRPTS
jgi:hypothetical protein